MRQTRFANPGTIQLAEGRSVPMLVPGSPQSATLRPLTETGDGFGTLLRRYRKPVILFFGILLVAAGLYWQFAPKSFKAETVLEIQGLNQDFMNIRDVSPTGSQMIDQTYIDTQIRLIQNPAVAAQVVEAMAGGTPSHPGAASAEKEAAVQKMLDSMKVKEEGASDLVSISLEGHNPQLVAATANQLAQQYIEEGQNARLSQATQTDTFLQQELNNAKDKLQSAEDTLQSYAHDSGIVLTSDTQEPVSTERLREIQQGLTQAQVDLAARQAQLDVARKSSADSLPDVLDDPVIREDKDKLRDLNAQLADLSTTMTPANYKVQQIQAQIQDVENEMAVHRNAIVKGLTVDQQDASRRTALLQNQYQQQLSAAMDQGSKQVHYNMLQNDVDVDRQIYQSMVQKVKEAGVNAALRTPNARVVSAAIAPITPSSPNPWISLAMGILLATVASMLYILVAERRNRSLRAPGETEVFLPSVELAAIPHAILPSRRLGVRRLNVIGQGDHRHHPMLAHWSKRGGTVMSEAFRMAGTSILLRTNNASESKILLITSPHPQCGKTMSTANLAISLAEASRKVVIVDGDLRKSGLSRVFGLESCPGLSDTLAGDGDDDPLKLIRSIDFPGVSILPSGTVSGNAARLLQSERLPRVLELLRAEFDFVLLDGPPLLGLADARLLGKHAEGIILVCRAGRTEGNELNEAWSILKDDGARILGTILNGYNLRTERPTRYSSYIGYTRTIS